MNIVEIAVGGTLIVAILAYVYTQLRNSDGDYTYNTVVDEDGNEVEEVIDLKDA